MNCRLVYSLAQAGFEPLDLELRVVTDAATNASNDFPHEQVANFRTKWSASEVKTAFLEIAYQIASSMRVAVKPTLTSGKHFVKTLIGHLKPSAKRHHYHAIPRTVASIR
jgi:hypothetical protein